MIMGFDALMLFTRFTQKIRIFGG